MILVFLISATQFLDYLLDRNRSEGQFINMSNSKLKIVITSIQGPTRSVERLAEAAERTGGILIVVADRKSPMEYPLAGSQYLSVAEQERMSYRLLQELPFNHYARKNIGYLHAISSGAPLIYETDDDNAPNSSWSPRSKKVEDVLSVGSDNAKGIAWLNVYQFFSAETIWPRGLPLEEIQRGEGHVAVESGLDRVSPIQQGLVNVSPDVDAVWRLTQDRPFTFSGKQSVYLEPGVWCPFNTQSTWWWPEAYPLLYVPSYCSFRMCDIWKSFVAQRCLWELKQGVTFHPPEVDQERNEHSLIKDFEDEIPGYLGNQGFVSCLEDLSLSSGAGNVVSNFVRCYEALVKASFFPKSEMHLVKAWAGDIEAIGG